MKSLLKSIAILALVVFTVGGLKAQQKIGHVNSSTLLQSMPEMKQADETFNTLRETKLKELEAMDQERQTKIASYQEKYKTLSEANKDSVGKELEALGQEIETMAQRIDELNQKSQQELATKREELYQPILAKADNAVKAVAKEQGYAYVFDVANQAVVYFEGGEDITDLVKKKLGIQ